MVSFKEIDLEKYLEKDFTKPNKIIISQDFFNLNKQLNFFKEHGITDVVLINFRQLRYSNTYSPFSFFINDKDIIDTCTFLEKELNFKDKIETTLLSALMMFLFFYRPKEEQNFMSIIKLLRATEIGKNNPNAKSLLDIIFNDVKKKQPLSTTVALYEEFKTADMVTQNNAISDLLANLNVFTDYNIYYKKDKYSINYLSNINDFSWKTNWSIKKITSDKIPLLVCMPDENDSLYFYAKLFIYQLFKFINLFNFVNIDTPTITNIFIDDSIKENTRTLIAEQNLENTDYFNFYNFKNSDLHIKRNKKLFLKFLNTIERIKYDKKIHQKPQKTENTEAKGNSIENEIAKITAKNVNRKKRKKMIIKNS